MDEILASIRKIIDEDDGKGAGPARGEDEAGEDEPLELGEATDDGAPPSGEASGSDGSEDVPASAAEDAATGDGLMSDAARSSAIAALGLLTRASDRDPLDGVPRGRPVEDLVMEQLKPMLSRWLDEHLPGIVERIVEREVRYLSRRLEGGDGA